MRALLVTALIASFPATQFLTPAFAQQPTPRVGALAARLAEKIRERNVRKIVVLDLRGPDQKPYPAGKWLAQQISSELQSQLPSLELVDYTVYEKQIADLKNQKPQPGVIHYDQEAARILGIDSTVDGSFAAYGKEIGITVQVRGTNTPAFSAIVFGSVPATSEILALSSDPLPEFPDGIYKASVAGISMPSCIRCPDPEYSEQARKAGYEGIVVLEIVVDSKGDVVSSSAIKGPNNGLIEKSQQAVRKWKFHAAVDWNGRPVQVRVPVEVSFRLFRNP